MLRVAGWFAAVVLFGWAGAQAVDCLAGRAGLAPDVPPKWPVSMFRFMLPGRGGSMWDLVAAAGVLAAFWIVARGPWQAVTRRLSGVILLGMGLIAATNLIHGIDYGLVHPHADELQYYHDATEVTSAGQFLGAFNDRQADLGCHSRTHPPGAVLTIYALAGLVGSPWAVSLAIAALSVTLSAWFFYGLLVRYVDRDVARLTTLLLLLLPAVQIYYCATLDALIAALMLGVLWSAVHPRAGVGLAVGIVCFFGASFLTFGACFLAPVIVGFEVVCRRSIVRSALVGLGAAAVYLAMATFGGFDYLSAFRTASALENPGGFLLWADPLSYVMTRLENVAEILLFFGPFLLVLTVRGWKVARADGGYRDLWVLTALGAGTLLAMFATGAFRTGETARACLFIYPYLLLPAAAWLDSWRAGPSEARRLAWLVFGQSLLMQTIGGYYW